MLFHVNQLTSSCFMQNASWMNIKKFWYLFHVISWNKKTSKETDTFSHVWVIYEVKIWEKKMKNTILRKKQRVAKREKKMANQISLKEDEMLAEKVKHFTVLYDKQVKGYKERFFTLFEDISHPKYTLVRFKALRRALFFLRLLNKRSNSNRLLESHTFLYFSNVDIWSFANLLSYNIPYWIEILVKNELRWNK